MDHSNDRELPFDVSLPDCCKVVHYGIHISWCPALLFSFPGECLKYFNYYLTWLFFFSTHLFLFLDSMLSPFVFVIHVYFLQFL